MEQVADFSRALAEFIEAAGITPDGSFDAGGVSSSTDQLRGAASRLGRDELAWECNALAIAADRLVTDGSPSSLLILLQHTERLLDLVEGHLEAYPHARVWWEAQRLGDVGEAVENFLKRSGNGQWGAGMQAEIVHLQPMRSAIGQVSWLLGEEMDATGVAGLLGTLEQRLDEDPAANLCALTWHVRPVLESQLRGAWHFTVAQGRQEMGLLESYEALWRALIRGLDRPQCITATTEAAAVAGQAGLAEVEDYCSDPEAVFYYGLDNLLPPAPRAGELTAGGGVAVFVEHQLSRWHFRPFRRRLAPLDVTRGVLRAGRPLYYERILAHSLVQYFLVQQAQSAGVVPGAAEVLRELANFCSLLERGYRLRREWIGRLKHPSDWVSYLEAAIAVHFTGGEPELGSIGTRLLARDRGRIQ